MYVLLYDGEVVKNNPPHNTKMAKFTTAELAWESAEDRANRFGVSLDKYEVAKFTPLRKVTRTVVAFVESE